MDSEKTRQSRDRLEDECNTAIAMVAASKAFDFGDPAVGSVIFKNRSNITCAILSRIKKHYRLVERAKRSK